MNSVFNLPSEKSTILIVDDEPAGRDTLEALLITGNYNLVFAGNGPEALQKAKKYQPDVILLDIMMPDMDGFEVCQQLRSDPDLFEIPVIMVTALDDRDSRLRGLEVGANDFVSKPFDRVELRTRIRTIAYLNRQRRLRTMELQIERDFNRAILDALGEALVVTDQHGTIQYVNRLVNDSIELPEKSIAGKNWLILGDNTLSSKHQEVKKTVWGGETWRGEITGIRQDGTTYDAMLTAAPLPKYYSSPEPSGFVLILRDITPLKESERLKDQFVSNVSHELKTPLAVITLITDNLDMLYNRLDDDKRKKMLGDIQKHTENLNTLIDSILEVSRLDSKRISLEREYVNLALITREEIDKLLPLAHQKNQDVTVSGTQSLPVWGHDGQLRQIIRNLITNAIKYTPEYGKIDCTFVIETEENIPESFKSPEFIRTKKKWAVIRFTDTGSGIDATSLPHIFERFYRVDTQNRVRGAGLGLSIVRELLTLHNGHITVDSVPDRGSIFTIYIPLLQEA